MLGFQALLKLEFPILSSPQPISRAGFSSQMGKIQVCIPRDHRPSAWEKSPLASWNYENQTGELKGAVPGGRLKAEICGTAGGMQGFQREGWDADGNGSRGRIALVLTGRAAGREGDTLFVWDL